MDRGGIITSIIMLEGGYGLHESLATMILQLCKCLSSLYTANQHSYAQTGIFSLPIGMLSIMIMKGCNYRQT